MVSSSSIGGAASAAGALACGLPASSVWGWTTGAGWVAAGSGFEDRARPGAGLGGGVRWRWRVRGSVGFGTGGGWETVATDVVGIDWSGVVEPFSGRELEREVHGICDVGEDGVEASFGLGLGAVLCEHCGKAKFRGSPGELL